MTVDEVESSSEWSREQDKAFENALANHPEDASDRWEKIAADVPGKTIEEIKQHYELLVEDIKQIESGCVPIPSYNSSSEGSASHASDEGAGKKGSGLGQYNSESNHGSKASRSDQERRKGEDEVIVNRGGEKGNLYVELSSVPVSTRDGEDVQGISKTAKERVERDEEGQFKKATQMCERAGVDELGGRGGAGARGFRMGDEQDAVAGKRLGHRCEGLQEEIGSVLGSKRHNLWHKNGLKIRVYVNRVAQPKQKISNFRIDKLA
ncbi:RADIALIS 1 [Spatholobus suberectus]|nr:RADIALIS 1 [Spatholobus suberectus]